MTTPGDPQNAPWQSGVPDPNVVQPGYPSAPPQPGSDSENQYPPGWQPGMAPPPTAKGRSTKFWLIGGGVVAVVAVIAIVLVTTLGGSGQSSTTSKPNIAALTVSMFLTENEMPTIDGGKFTQTGLEPIDKSPTEKCPVALQGEGGRNRVRKSERKLDVTLFRLDPKPDAATFRQCQFRPMEPQAVSIPELPSDVTVVHDLADDDIELTAIGEVRGVFIAVKADYADASMDQVKADVAAAYNAQADKLNKA